MTVEQVVVREISDGERDYWDEHVQTVPHVHPLNAYDWGTVRQVDGWRPIRLVAERSGRFCGALLLLTKRLPLLPYRFFYGPKGPICHPDDEEVIRALHGKVLELARTLNAIFVRIDPNFREDEGGSFERIAADLKYVHLPQRWTFWNSPRDVYRIDLDGNGSIDDVYNALGKSTKRCIRQAAKEGVQVEAATNEDDLKAFYQIFKEFAVTKGFMVRGYDYQKKLWDCYIARGKGRIFLAKYQGNVIGGVICIVFGRKCLDMHACALYEYRRLQTYYAFGWEAIRWAKEMGCVWYSFRGVGTTPTQEEFKRKWNPEIVPLMGYFDCPFKPALYKVFHWCEFTLLPALYPLIITSRRIASRVMKQMTLQRSAENRGQDSASLSSRQSSSSVASSRFF